MLGIKGQKTGGGGVTHAPGVAVCSSWPRATPLGVGRQRRAHVTGQGRGPQKLLLWSGLEKVSRGLVQTLWFFSHLTQVFWVAAPVWTPNILRTWLHPWLPSLFRSEEKPQNRMQVKRGWGRKAQGQHLFPPGNPQSSFPLCGRTLPVSPHPLALWVTCILSPEREGIRVTFPLRVHLLLPRSVPRLVTVTALGWGGMWPGSEAGSAS